MKLTRRTPNQEAYDTIRGINKDELEKFSAIGKKLIDEEPLNDEEKRTIEELLVMEDLIIREKTAIVLQGKPDEYRKKWKAYQQVRNFISYMNQKCKDKDKKEELIKRYKLPIEAVGLVAKIKKEAHRRFVESQRAAGIEIDER